MNSTVNLDHKLALGTTEIDDKMSQGILPAKLRVIQTPEPQARPQLAFSLCLNTSEVLGGWDQSKANPHAWPPPSSRG